jgi:hypothetical protein
MRGYKNMFEEIYREIAYKPIDKMSKRELDLFIFFLKTYQFKIDYAA